LRIAFTYGGKLWLWQNGRTQHLTSLEGYAGVNISDDGEIIVFARDGELWGINSDGSNERVLVKSTDFESMEPKDPGVALNQFDWIPGTHGLLFNTIVLTDYGRRATDDLYFLDADTRQWTLLRQSGEGGKFDVSADGQRVVMTTPSQISLMNVDGSDYRVMLTYTVPYPSEVPYYARPVWAADSKSLTVAIPPEDFYYETTSPTDIWRLPIDGNAPEIVSQLPAGDDGDDARIWSPDKRYYAIRSGDRYYLGMDGADLEPLTESSSIFGWFSWVDELHFLYIGPCELRLGTIGEQSILIADLSTTDDCISSYDFVK
jgi:Tol biopolymer transport system component